MGQKCLMFMSATEEKIKKQKRKNSP